LGRKRWWGRFALILGGLLLGGGAAELGVRLLRPDDAADLLYSAPDNAPDGLYLTDTELFSVPAPGFTGPQRSLGYEVDLRINSQGLRGAEVNATRPMWVVAGDSFTMAAQVSEAETFVSQLAEYRGGQFLNAGVDGYGTWRALHRYERIDDAMDVDGLLIVLFAGNDLADNARWNMEQSDAANLTAGEPIWRPRQNMLHRWLYPRSVLYARAQMWLRARELSDPKSPERQRWANELMPFTHDGEALLKGLMVQTKSALVAVRAATLRRGDRLMVAVAPPAFQIETARLDATFSLVGLEPQSANPDQVTDAVSKVLGQIGVPACDLVAPLRTAHRDGKQMYLAYDGHWSPAGHQVVAKTISQCLNAQ
jgi:hypothetical protein